MAETLTVDTTPQTETLGDSLTSDEQESLAIGEEMMQQQEQMLAGKYKNAEELEKAYIELSKKLGEKSEPDTEQVESEPEEEEEISTQPSPAAELITSANDEFLSNDGKLSPETLDKFSSMSSKELVEAYMEVQTNLQSEQQQQQTADLSQQAVNDVKNFAGGEEAYANIVNWASGNLDKGSIEAFDQIVNSGSIEAIKIAVSGLKAQYENANGYEGRMISGKTAPPKQGDTFRSQAELVQAMADRRYDNDPAYRQDVLEKLGRSSDLAF